MLPELADRTGADSRNDIGRYVSVKCMKLFANDIEKGIEMAKEEAQRQEEEQDEDAGARSDVEVSLLFVFLEPLTMSLMPM